MWPRLVSDVERTQLPTLGEFVEACTKKHGCRVLEMNLNGPRGAVISRYLCRSNGERSFAALPDIDNEEHLTADVLVSMCNRLHLPPYLFGLFVG